MNRFLRMCLLSCLILGTACGGDNNENSGTNNGSNNTTTNNTTGSNNTVNNTTDPNVQTNNTTPEAQCDAANEACVSGEPTNAGFVCVEDVCRQECDPEGDDCRSGSLCGAISDAGPFFCIPSDCNGWLDTSSCSAGEQCVAFINDTDLCTAVGDLAEGEACEQTEANPFPCGAGLFCAFGTCTEICGDDSACDTGEGERCIQDTLDNGVGVCAVGCDSYSVGQCPAGQGCFPVTEVDGICDDVGSVGPYQPCDDTNTCGENTACITFQGADALTGAQEIARCLPFCNPIPETAPERNATCPQPGNAMGYGRFVHLTEGAGAVDIYVDGTLEVDDLTFEAVSDAGQYIALTPGTRTIDITAGDAPNNSAPLLTVSPSITGSTAVTWAIIPDSTTTISVITVAEPRGEAAPAAGNSKLRPVHAIPDFGAVDVVAVAAGATDFTGEVELALNLATGAAGNFTEVPAGNYDIYLFPAGTTPRTTANATGVTVAGVAVPANVTVGVYARGTADAGDSADPGLTNVAYVSAPAASGSLGGWCLDLGEEPSANSGFCIEDCGTSDTFGTNSCTTAGDTCTPLSGGFFGCFPGGPNGPGDACDPDRLENGCDDTSFCLAYGDGTGVCKSYCQPDSQTNPLLGCTGADECAPFQNNLGQCQTPCTPTNFADTTTCPAALQTCAPSDRGEPAYCAASGNVADGGSCAALSGDCQAGSDCVNDFAIDISGDDFLADGVCAPMCDPFGDGSECGAGEVCSVSFLTLNRAAGFCIQADEMLAANAPCAAGSRVCGQSSVCLDVGAAQTQCIKLCDLDDSSTCGGGTCNQLFGTTEIRIGFCG